MGQSEAMGLFLSLPQNGNAGSRTSMLSPLPSFSSSTIRAGRAVREAKSIRRGRGIIMGQVQTELKADVLRITIDRPEKKNALTTAMYTALADAVEAGESNPDVRVMLL